MDAIKGNIKSILDGNNKQFVIPVYQRTYSWNKEQWNRLWNDISKMQMNNLNSHFVGSIVNIAEQTMPTGIQKFMIIDGQQRITTLTLLLIALRDYLKNNEGDHGLDYREVNATCIQNDYKKDEEKYKLILTKSDRDELIKLVDNNKLEIKSNSRVSEAYEFFYKKIENKELLPIDIWEGVAKLQIVNITLDRTVDDPQLIFESLNSTGVDLSQSDLIRNNILMGLEIEQQKEIYSKIWFPMEELFGATGQSTIMDRFFRDYLTYKSGKIPTIYRIYEDFKDYKKEETNIEEFCKDLYFNAKLYTNLIYSKSDDNDLNTIFKDISQLKMEVSYPFILKVYVDYYNEIISKEEFIIILKLIESYVFRRSINGIPTNSLNKTFMSMIKTVKNDDYLNSIKAFLIMLDSYKLLPKNEEFKREFLQKDIYNMRTRNYILSKFENFNNKGPINIENYTVEHIIPQNPNLNEDWQNILGENWKEVQKNYLHTIGNLTLTAYNSELSDKSFIEKMEMPGGFKESALRINSFVVKQDNWNEDILKERAKKLVDLSTNIWEYPYLEEDELEVYLPKDTEIEYSLYSYEQLTGNTLNLYKLLDKRIINISSDVKRQFNKIYIAYKSDTNFVDIIPLKTKLIITLNMKFNELVDPNGIARDMTNIGHWGNGDVEVNLEDESQIDDIMELVIQSYNKQLED